MGFFNRKQEKRATGEVSYEDSLLQALLNPGAMTKATALQIPTVSSAINLIGEIVAGTPIKLYQEVDGKAVEVKGDPRVRLLNDDPGDALNAHDMWKALVSDYYLGKGGYAYINKPGGNIKSLHYVDESFITVQSNTNHIFKDFDIYVDGQRYFPFDFLKILRNSKDGASGKGIVSENSSQLTVAYQTLLFEAALVQKGGNKKGFLKSQKKLSDPAMTELKAAWKRLYSNNEENVIVLNDGVDFTESSNTSVEMQLNENKLTNGDEMSKLFRASQGVLTGNPTEQELSGLAKLAAVPLMVTIQCACNKDLLLEKEKGSYYFAFDTKELLKGSMKDRYEAYAAGIEANVLQIDEARFMEDLPALGFKFIKLGLDTVLYDPATKKVYTPNTNLTQDLKQLGSPNTQPNGGETV